MTAAEMGMAIGLSIGVIVFVVGGTVEVYSKVVDGVVEG